MNIAVVGLGFGDEGKGHVVAWLCSNSKKPIVIRFCGGHQVGHTVIHNDIRHVHASFGSGTLLGVPTLWSANTFSPTHFLNEFEVLEEKKINPKIYVHAKTPITTPFEILKNEFYENLFKHGSCGVGYGTTIEREKLFFSLLVEDMRFPSVFKEKLKQIEKFYKGMPIGIKTISETEIKKFLLDCNKAYQNIIIRYNQDNVLKHFETHIYESSQGLMLDQNIGFFPHVTRGSIRCEYTDHEIYYVTRAYQTRHGNGPMTNEDIPYFLINNPKETNVYNEYQGEFRKTVLDLDLLSYAIVKDLDHNNSLNKNLVITCLDHVKGNWKATLGGVLFRFAYEKHFIEFIVDNLPVRFTKIYLSFSNDYTKIMEF